MPTALASRSSTHRALARWIAPCCLLLCVFSAAYAVAAAWAGSEATWRALQSIGLLAIGVGAAVCLGTLLMRFLRWRLLLAAAGHRLPDRYSVRVYLAGLALSSTPGKLGETLRSALLLERGVPLPQSLAAFVADRASDVIGVAWLGAIAGWATGHRLPWLEALALVSLLGSLAAASALRRPVVAERLLRRQALRRVPYGATGHPWLTRMLCAIAKPALAWASLWQGTQLLACVLVAVAVYGLQAGVMSAYAAQLVPGIGVADGVAMFASAVLIGAASGLPGGLGAMDGALVVQLQSHGATWAEALAITLATRASTLWLAWLIGFAALASFARASVPAPEPTVTLVP